MVFSPNKKIVPNQWSEQTFGNTEVQNISPKSNNSQFGYMPGNFYEMELEQDQAFKMSPNVNSRRYIASGVTFDTEYEEAPKRT